MNFSFLADIITVLFFLVVLSYYFFMFLPRKKPDKKISFSSISIIIPAHNEEEFIADCIDSVLASEFPGKKEIVVVDDGSIDNTAKIVKQYRHKGVKLIRNKHSGKSYSINAALEKTSGELVAIVDGDSVISQKSLVYMAQVVSGNNVGGSTCVVKVKNRRRLLCIWPHIEQLYNSMMRAILSKANANISTPGPLSVYRRDALEKIGGFSTEGFSEDLDITIRLIRAGYTVSFSEKAFSETNLPYDLKNFFRQRTRFARGMLNLFKRHLKINNTLIDIYTLPLFVFMYIQAIIMGSFTIYQIVSGYMKYFLSSGIYFNFGVLSYLFDWVSIVGFVKWAWSVIIGSTPMGFISMAGVFSTLLTYPLYLYAIFKYDKKFDFLHALTIFFMAPFWWLIMAIYILCLPEIFARKQYNRWKKNE